MPGTDTIVIGDPMPVIDTVFPINGFQVAVRWAAGTRAGRSEVIDLAPPIHTYRAFRRLRSDADLFQTVHIVAMGSAIAWGSDDETDMAATTLERLAEEQMSPADFSGTLKQLNLSFEGAAARLGISRRLVAYYASGNRPVPRYIALACKYLMIEVTRHGPGESRTLAEVARSIENLQDLAPQTAAANLRFAGGTPDKP